MMLEIDDNGYAIITDAPISTCALDLPGCWVVIEELLFECRQLMKFLNPEGNSNALSMRDVINFGNSRSAIERRLVEMWRLLNSLNLQNTSRDQPSLIASAVCTAALLFVFGQLRGYLYRGPFMLKLNRNLCLSLEGIRATGSIIFTSVREIEAVIWACAVALQSPNEYAEMAKALMTEAVAVLDIRSFDQLAGCLRTFAWMSTEWADVVQRHSIV
jgi:hypothetical protein